MARQERYFIGPTLLGEIRETITRVDAIAPRTSGAAFDPRLQTLDSHGPQARRLQRGTFSGAWNVGETKVVTCVENTNSTVVVTNYTVPISAGEFGAATATATVIFGSVSGTQTAIELPSRHMRLGKSQTTWTKGTAATIDLYETGTAGSETYSGTLSPVWNKFADVQSGKWVMVGRGPYGAWYLISAEC